MQNAADAAAEADIRGQVRIQLRNGLLEVANTGAPLSAAGVAAAATLRASAKRSGGSVGRFGVGFAAVLSVTDEPELVSRSGGVRWSKAATSAEIAAVPALAPELAQRRGHVPVLRLPYPVVDLNVTAGYETVVRLPLSEAGEATARQLLTALDPTLLLVLPTLAEVVISVSTADGTKRVRTLRCEWEGPDAVLNGEAWTGVVRSGRLDAALLADRGVEEQNLEAYEIRVLLPEGEWPAEVPRVLRAPQPTDEALSIPAFIVAPLPVEPGRRRIVPGRLADTLLGETVEALVELAERTGDLRLVPTDLPAGPVDAAIVEGLRDRLPQARMLPGNRRGADSLVLELGAASDAVSELLRDDLAGLLPARFTGPRWAAARRVLGVTEVEPGELVTLLSGIARPAQWWARLYPALRALPDRDALAALPVPLADGRTVTGPRGVLLPGPELDAAALTGLPLRLADPAVASGAAAELLRGLGALDADPATLLADPAVTDDSENPVPYQAVLALVAALGPSLAGVPTDLGERLLLPGADGEPWPAQELLLAGGPLAAVIRADAPFGVLAADVAAAYPPEVLEAAGVLRTFGVLRATDVLLDPDDPVLLELDGSDEWLAELGGGSEPVIADFHAIRDLELVRWPDALAALAGDELRAEVMGSPYTCWWLGAHPVLPAGRLPRECALPGELAALHEPAPGELDAAFLAAIGVRTTIAALSDPTDLYDVLDRLGDPARDVDWPAARRLYLAVAAALRAAGQDELDEEPPDHVRTVAGVVPRAQAVIVDRPDLLPLIGDRAVLRFPPSAAPELARILGVRLASRLAAYDVVSTSPLTVRDADGVPQQIAWFGAAHDATPDGQARAQAWSSGRWSERHAIAAALRQPQLRELFAAEADLDAAEPSPQQTP